MNKPNFASLKLFITGPTYIRDDVKQAALLPEFGHRDTENDLRFGPIRENLRILAGAGDAYEPVLFLGSGSTAMEASIRSLVAEGETLLNVSVGAFGDHYYNIAVANGKKAENLKFDYGQAIDMAVLEKKLAELKPEVVSFTHNETSTGVTNDMKAVCALIRKHGAMPLVDGVSIFGGADLDLANSGAAMYSTATQKSLALPAGFGIGFISREAEEKAKAVTCKGPHHGHHQAAGARPQEPDPDYPQLHPGQPDVRAAGAHRQGGGRRQSLCPPCRDAGHGRGVGVRP